MPVHQYEWQTPEAFVGKHSLYIGICGKRLGLLSEVESLDPMALACKPI